MAKCTMSRTHATVLVGLILCLGLHSPACAAGKVPAKAPDATAASAEEESPSIADSPGGRNRLQEAA